MLKYTITIFKILLKKILKLNNLNTFIGREKTKISCLYIIILSNIIKKGLIIILVP